MTGIAASHGMDEADALAAAEDRLRLFASAARESRRVRRLRVLLPAAGLVLALVVAGTTVLSRIAISLAIGDLKITAAGLAMDAPHLSGSDGKGRTYAVSAEGATQDLRDTRVIRLAGIKATVTQPDGSSARISADSGVYDSAAQSVVLSENIRLDNSDGSGGRLERAEIDLDTGTLRSDSPVAFSSSFGDINAEKMGVAKSPGTVTFSGGVRMTIDPTARKGNPASSLSEAEGKRP